MAQKEACVPPPETKRANSKFLKGLGRSVMLLPFLIAARTDSTPAENFTSNTHRGTSAPEQLVVMTANVHGWKTAEGQPGYRQFRRTLDEVKPDVVCIQEALADSSKISDLSKVYNIAFTTTKRDNFGIRFGNMVLSTAPIEIEAVHKLQHNTTPEPRSALTVSVGDDIRLTNVHLSVDPYEASQQLLQVGEHEANQSEILCGDFNSGDPTAAGTPHTGRSVTFQPFSGYTATEQKPTFPSGAPEKRLDFVLSDCVTSDTTQLIAEVVPIGSDHDGVVAKLNRVCIKD